MIDEEYGNRMKALIPWLCVGLLLPAAARGEEQTTTHTDIEEVVSSNNAFAVDLYSQLKSRPGNLIFSPMSISIALAMTYAGARGETAREMAKVLHFTAPPERLNPAMGALLKEFNAVHAGYQLRMANALWGQQGYPFLDTFLMQTQEDYGAGFDIVDFRGATENARQTINRRIEEQSNSEIKQLIQPGVLNTSTRLVLTNGIYFKGDWQAPFKQEDTKADDFHLSTERTIKSPIMHRRGSFNYYDGGTYQVLEIPYSHENLSMVVLLPRAVDGLPAIERTLRSCSIQHWLDQVRPQPEVIVAIPKFRIEAQFKLVNTLEAMGMRQAFGSMADFSGMDGNRDLFVSAVIQKAYVEVDEKGTKATAATATVHHLKKVKKKSPAFIFHADHPFLFLIRDNRSGAILFMGRIADPLDRFN